MRVMHFQLIQCNDTQICKLQIYLNSASDPRNSINSCSMIELFHLSTSTFAFDFICSDSSINQVDIISNESWWSLDWTEGQLSSLLWRVSDYLMSPKLSTHVSPKWEYWSAVWLQCCSAAAAGRLQRCSMSRLQRVTRGPLTSPDSIITTGVPCAF